MSDKIDEYRSGGASLSGENRLWPLYGPGFENLGDDGQPIELPVPEIGPDELLVRHDACGLCFSDIKVIKAGQAHPRIYRDMSSDPVVLGHEVSMTIVRVGENLRDRYQVGDRFIVQADIFLNGVSYAYGYELQGGLSRYNVIDWRVLNGDHGNYLIPVQDSTGYAESALTEPWACVIAAYQLKYRTGLKPGGTCWIIGTARSSAKTYTIGAGFDENSHPARLLLTDVPQAFASWLKERASSLGIQVEEISSTAQALQAPSTAENVAANSFAADSFAANEFADIVVLGADADIIETVSPRLADHGILAIIADEPLPRKVSVDVGRVHYNRWVYVGGKGPDIARAYSDTPVRSTLKSGGRAWFAGAGGPMGRMHVQRAIQVSEGPATILCTDVSDLRLEDLCTSYAAEAKAKGIEFVCVNPTKGEQYQSTLAAFREKGGFDDIIVLAPIPALISEAAGYLAPQGVMNVFAGVTRGVAASLDLSDAYLKGTRIIGHSASTIEDLRLMLHQAESGELSPNRSVAAVGSLSAARDGLKAVHDTLFPGKVVIFPQIKEFPLTALPDLKEKLPSVYGKLRDGREWTVEAEEEFLRLMLP